MLFFILLDNLFNSLRKILSIHFLFQFLSKYFNETMGFPLQFVRFIYNFPPKIFGFLIRALYFFLHTGRQRYNLIVMLIRIHFMFNNFLVYFIIKFTIIEKHMLHFPHFSDNETILLNEILHFYTSTKKSLIYCHYIVRKSHC